MVIAFNISHTIHRDEIIIKVVVDFATYLSFNIILHHKSYFGVCGAKFPIVSSPTRSNKPIWLSSYH